MNVHLEAFLRILGISISVYFTAKWTIGTNPPTYDLALTLLAVNLAVALNYV
jgi:hypothetical protein